MRRIITAALLTAFPAAIAAAQDQTLIGNSATYGGFGGPVMKLTRIAGKDAFLMGGRGGLIVNGTYVIGGGGTGWNSNSVRGNDGIAHRLEVNYGGVDLEYIHATREVVHWAVQLTLGSGSASQGPMTGPGEHDDSFFLAEPGVHAELNVTKGIRIGAGVSYRFVNGVELPAFSNADLRGATATFTFKFGKFH